MGRSVPAEGSFSCKRDRKSTRLNSSHLVISYAVFCLKKKKKYRTHPRSPSDIPSLCHPRLSLRNSTQHRSDLRLSTLSACVATPASPISCSLPHHAIS